MKLNTKHLPIIIASTVLVISAIITNLNANEYDPHAHKHNHGSFAEHLFDKMDNNNDKVVSLDEIRRHSDQFLTTMDDNGNGVIEQAEAVAHGKQVSDFAKVDTNQDGVVDAEENFAVDHNRFQHADDNNDGNVTWEEYKKHYIVVHGK